MGKYKVHIHWKQRLILDSINLDCFIKEYHSVPSQLDRSSSSLFKLQTCYRLRWTTFSSLIIFRIGFQIETYVFTLQLQSNGDRHPPLDHMKLYYYHVIRNSDNGSLINYIHSLYSNSTLLHTHKKKRMSINYK